MNPALKQALRQQRTTIFGNHRYWFHIAIWALVILTSMPDVQDFGKGMVGGITVVNSPKYKDGDLEVQAYVKTIDSAKKDQLITLKDGKKLDLKHATFYYSIVIGGLLAAVMIYFFLLFAIPYARYKQQKRILILSIIANLLFFTIAMIISGLLLSQMVTAHAPKEQRVAIIVIPLILIFILALLVTGAFFAIYYFIDLYDQQKALNQYQQVFTHKLQAETNFLKMQINPHFLFNTLNNIYSLTLSQSDAAVIITRQLKELVHYMLEDCAKETVPLNGELEFLSNYIALEKLRNKQDNVTIDLVVKGDTNGKNIAPLLLVNFIENAFKHGVKAGIDHSFVTINLLVKNKTLSMEVTNSKPPINADQKLAVHEDSGIGIKNVKRRLEILYPGNYKLKVNETSENYSVLLNIVL